MTLNRHASLRLLHSGREGQHSQAVEPSRLTPPALSMQERARSHGLRRLTSFRPLRPGEEGLETMSADSRMLPRLSKQGRVQPQDIVPPRLTLPAPSK